MYIKLYKKIDEVQKLKNFYICIYLSFFFFFQISEYFGKILGVGSDVFKSEDLVLWGEVPLPRRTMKLEFPPEGPGIVPIAGIINLSFST